MNNPLDTNAFKHYLSIDDIGLVGLYQISEPVGFDAMMHEVQQEPKRFARDVNFSALDGLEFVDAESILAVQTQIVDQYGNTSDHLDYGLNWLLYGLEKKGFELKAYYHLSKNGVFAPKMQLDFTENDLTDGFSYVKCKLIDNNDVMDYKRNEDEKFNAFAIENFKGSTITPIQTINYLRKATPKNQVSKFRSNGITVTAFAWTLMQDSFVSPKITQRVVANNCNVVEEYGVENTLSYLSSSYAGIKIDGVVLPNNSGSFQFFEAQNDLTDVNININEIVASSSANQTGNPFGSTTIESANGNARVYILIGNDLEAEPFDAYLLYNRLFDLDGNLSSQPLPSQLSLTLPFVERGKRCYIYFACDSDAEFDGAYTSLLGFITQIQVTSLRVEIKAVSTSLDVVIKACRYIDLIKQASKHVNDIPIVADKFNVGGEFYNQVVFNRSMVSQKTDYFYSTPKQTFGSVEEVCADYEINPEAIFIDTYDKFYTNNEIGVFPLSPSKDSAKSYNQKYMINSFKYGYSKFEQDRTVLGTSSSIHTESEWRVPNLMVENVKEIKNAFVRDALAIQTIIDLEIKQPTTTTSDDNDVFIEEITPLAPSSFGSFGARLLMRIIDGKLEIFNRDSNGDSGNVVINWTILGFGVGNNFEITDGQNVGNYTVFSLTNSVLTLTPVSFTPSFEGDGFVKVKYYYQNVAYQTLLTQGVLIPSNNFLSSIRYSIKRNIFRWGSYIKTAMMYSQGVLKNTFFKGDGSFESQFNTDSVSIIENSNIDYDDLNDALITPIVYDLTLVAEFEDVLNFMNTYKVSRGFIRCTDIGASKVIKGYVQKLAHNWSTNELKVTIEERNEGNFLRIDGTINNLFVNDAPYNLSGVANWWKLENDFIQLFDEKSRPLSNKYEFNLVILNDTTYATKNELIEALLLLQT